MWFYEGRFVSTSEHLPGRPRAVLFDLGNTLALPDWPRIVSVTAGAAPPLGGAELQRRVSAVMVEADRRADFLRAVAEGSLAPGWEFRELYRGLGIDGARLDGLMSELTREHEKRHLWSVLNADAPPLLEELRRGGMRLAVISNSPDGRAEELVRLLGLGDYFDLCVDSQRVGYAKPDPRIFSRAVAGLEVEPADAVYVGDSYAQDVAGALDAGLRGVLYDPHELRPGLGVVRINSLKELPGTWGA